jgi:hypothetical protein
MITSSTLCFWILSPPVMVLARMQIEKSFEVFDKTGMIPVKCDKTRKNTKLRVMLVRIECVCTGVL